MTSVGFVENSFSSLTCTQTASTFMLLLFLFFYTFHYILLLFDISSFFTLFFSSLSPAIDASHRFATTADSVGRDSGPADIRHMFLRSIERQWGAAWQRQLNSLKNVLRWNNLSNLGGKILRKNKVAQGIAVTLGTTSCHLWIAGLVKNS